MNKTTHQGVFIAPYEIVWQSALLTLKNYPLVTEDVESGEIETEVIRGYSVWKPPEGMIPNQSKRRYRIKIFLEKGQVESNQAIKVHIIKNEKLDEDFIEHSTPVISSNLEEDVILYRIHREILLEKKKVEFKKKDELKKTKSR